MDKGDVKSVATQLQCELDQAKNLAYRALEDGHSERLHLFRVGANDNQRCVAGGHRNFGISVANVLFIAVLPCTASTLGLLPDLVCGRSP